MRLATVFLLGTLLVFSIMSIPSTAQVEGDAMDITSDTLWTTDHDIIGTLFVSNNSTLTVRDCTLNSSGVMLAIGSVLILENVDANIEYLEAEGSELTITNAMISAELGMIMTNGSVVISNTEVDSGVLVENGSLEALNSSFAHWDVGLGAMENSSLEANNVTIYDAQTGVFLSESSGSLDDIRVNGTISGLFAESSELSVTNSIFQANEDGVVAMDSVVTLDNVELKDHIIGCGPSGCGSSGKGDGISVWNTIIEGSGVDALNNSIGIYAYKSNISLEDSLARNNTLFGVQLEQAKLWTNHTDFQYNTQAIESRFVNNSWLDNSSTWGSNTFTQNDIAFSQTWEVLVRVSDEQNRSISGALVIAEGISPLGYSNQTEISDPQGLADLELVSYMLYDNGTTIDFQYELNTTKEGTNATAPTTYQHLETLTLQDNVELNNILPIIYPDLEAWVMGVELISGDNEIQLRVQVNNTGEAAAFDFAVQVVEHRSTGFYTIIAVETLDLNAGENVVLVVPWTGEDKELPAGNYTIVVEVDPYNTIDEIDKDDNVFNKDVTIKLQPGEFPLTQVLGSIALVSGFVILVFALKRQKPDVGKRV